MPAVLAEVQKQELREKLWFSGSILSRKRAVLAAESKGRIIVMAEVGDHFEKGDIVAQFDSLLLEQEIAEQQAEGVSQQANIKFLTNETKRLTELVKDHHVAQSQLEETQANLDATKAMYAASQARVAHTTELVRRMKVVAPFDGIISERYAEVGEWLSEGDDIATLINPQDLEITTAVPAYVLPHISIGDSLEVEVDAQTYAALLRAIVPVADDQSRLFELRLNLSAFVGYAQQLVRVAVPTSSGRSSLVVPEDALVIRSTGLSVMAVNQDYRVRRVPVQVGMSTGDGLIEVSGDHLQPGDQVIIRGAERAREGMTIRPVSTPQSKTPQE